MEMSLIKVNGPKEYRAMVDDVHVAGVAPSLSNEQEGENSLPQSKSRERKVKFESGKLKKDEDRARLDYMASTKSSKSTNSAQESLPRRARCSTMFAGTVNAQEVNYVVGVEECSQRSRATSLGSVDTEQQTITQSPWTVHNLDTGEVYMINFVDDFDFDLEELYELTDKQQEHEILRRARQRSFG